MAKEQTAIEYCEEKFPQTTNEFKKILDEMYDTFCKKQRNYGPDNISVGSSLESDDDRNVALNVFDNCQGTMNSACSLFIFKKVR